MGSGFLSAIRLAAGRGPDRIRLDVRYLPAATRGSCGDSRPFTPDLVDVLPSDSSVAYWLKFRQRLDDDVRIFRIEFHPVGPYTHGGSVRTA
jgi:hypothetical protein